MKFAWVFIAAAVVAGCSGGSDTAANPTATPAAPAAAAKGGGASAHLVAPHAKGAGTMEKVAAHDAAMAAEAAKYSNVQALFTKNCVKCHSGPTPKYKLDLSSYETVMKGGAEGPVVVADNPDASIIVKALNGKGAKQMPPQGPLSKADVKAVEDWIKAGAKNG